MYRRLCVSASLLIVLSVAAAAQTTPHRVYPFLMDARENPDYNRRHVQPPNWEHFQ